MSKLAGAPCWIELFTSEPERSHALYAELFGWTTKDMGEEYGGYANFLADGELVGGCMRNDGSAGTPDVWTVSSRPPTPRPSGTTRPPTAVRSSSPPCM